MAHILGEEAFRALVLLRVPDAPVPLALAESTKNRAQSATKKSGYYCCSRCSSALWRSAESG